MKRGVVSCTSVVLCLMAVWVLSGGTALAQQAPAAAAELQQQMGEEAMKYIASRFVVDSTIVVPQTEKPISGQGTWTVSQTRPSTCPKVNHPCVLVTYAEPGTDIVCQWTVLLRGGVDRDFLVDLNEDAARYLTESPERKKTWVGGMWGGNVLRCTKPLYSKDVKLPRTRGVVKLLVRYDETGYPIEVKGISGLEELQALAADAYRHCVYTPLKIDGVPVPIGNLKVIDYDAF